MCGIAGAFCPAGANEEERMAIATVTRALAHRGPDGEGLRMSSDGVAMLGHRRLSILDPTSRSDQPMAHPEADLLLVFNGEIFNFLELKAELQVLGHKFRTDSDTEVILAAYLAWGVDMLKRFNGMWALALYDGRRRQMLLSRDRHGIKPLFYTWHRGSLYFASEVQAIEALLGPDHPMDERVVQELLIGGFAHYGTELTYLKDVKGLPPGHNIIVSLDVPRPRPYQWYQLQHVTPPTRFADQVEQLRELLADACRLRLRTDVPLATCLSGGIDSCALVGMMAGNYGRESRFAANYDHVSFTAAFPGQYNDEQDAAQRMANFAKGRLEVIPILPPTPTELEQVMAVTDGPMHAMAFYPITRLYEGIREKGIKVTIDGIGPDEMMGGYRPVEAALRSAVQMRDPMYFYDIYRTYAAQGEHPFYSSRKHTNHIVKLIAKHMVGEVANGFRQGAGRALRKAGLLKPLGPAAQPMDMSLPEGIDFVFNLPDSPTVLEEVFYRDFFQQPMQTILHQYDRSSMGAGVESRMPFMDYRLVEYIFSLPLKSKVGNGHTKRILREAMQGVVPDDIRLNKIKLGFNAPHGAWLSGSLSEWARDISATKTFSENPYFDANHYRSLLGSHLAGKMLTNVEQWQLWPALHLMWWQQHRKERAGRVPKKASSSREMVWS